MAQLNEIQDTILGKMLAAVEAKDVSGPLVAVRETLIKKIQAERDRLNSMFEMSDTTYRTPSMGVVELSHESLPESTPLFATDIRSKDIIRIKIFAASKNIETGAIIKEGLLTEFVMSEMQFGEAIVQAEGSKGYPVTIISDSAMDVPPYDPDLDATKGHMAALAEEISSHPEQVNNFMSEAKDILDRGADKGRLGKAEIEALSRKIGSVTLFSIDSGLYSVQLLSEAMDKRTNEAALNMNVSGKMLMISHKG